MVKLAYLPDPVRGAQNKRGHRKPVPLFFGRLQREGNVEFKVRVTHSNSVLHCSRKGGEFGATGWCPVAW